jgi:hypothetical protein
MATKGRKCLPGCTCGRHDPQALQHRSDKLKGRPKTEEHRAKLTAANRANALNPDWQQKHVEGMRKMVSNPVWLNGVTAANRRKWSDPDWRRQAQERARERATPLDLSTKRCCVCSTEKDKSEFNRNKSSRDGLQSCCRVCQSAKQKRFRPKYQERERAYRDLNRDRRRDQTLRRQYGMGSAEYDALFSAQLGVCAICGNKEVSRHKSGEIKPLAVDHDHKTGRVRGLLCTSCNLAIGQFREHPERLQRAIDYLCRAN